MLGQLDTLLDLLRTLIDGPYGFGDTILDVVYEGGDLLGGPGDSLGKSSYLIGDYREASSLFASPRGLNCCV